MHTLRGPATILCSFLVFQALCWIASPAALADGPAGRSARAFVVQPESDQPQQEIQKGYFQLVMAPDEARTVRVVAKNTGDGRLSLRNYLVDSYQVKSGGLDFSVWGKPQSGVSRWMSLDTPSLELAPGEARRITVTLQVPPATLPGDHVGGLAIEDQEVRTEGGAGSVLIDVHSRQVLALMVTVPGEKVSHLEVTGVALAPSKAGSRALVDLRNDGNMLVRGQGTLEIQGGQAAVMTVPFKVDTMLPQGQTQVALDLPKTNFGLGDYDARINVDSDDHAALANWRGSVTVAAKQPEEAGPGPAAVFLEPARVAVSSVGEFPVMALLIATLLLLAGIALGVMVGRRGSATR